MYFRKTCLFVRHVSKVIGGLILKTWWCNYSFFSVEGSSGATVEAEAEDAAAAAEDYIKLISAIIP